MLDQIRALELEITEAVAGAKTPADLEQIEITFLGRKGGKLTSILKGLANVAEAERPKVGALANEVKGNAERMIAAKRREMEEGALGSLAERERVDVTEPGKRPPQGRLHIVNQAIEEIAGIFERAGFTHLRAPDVEWDWYAFEALNMPKDHPARDEWETFFIDVPPSQKWGKMILTPHATSGTARLLAEKKLPLRAITISKTYRRQIDVTHVPMFHQFDGVVVDKGLGITHLRGVLDYFVKTFFGPEREARLRPFHFRFTEPSFEIDISCGVCGGTGVGPDKLKCRTCKRGWLELGGAGMLHPNVLKAAGINPKVYSGLAFGWGVERTYMMKEGVKLDDIRILYKNDLRFLKQF